MQYLSTILKDHAGLNRNQTIKFLLTAWEGIGRYEKQTGDGSKQAKLLDLTAELSHDLELKTAARKLVEICDLYLSIRDCPFCKKPNAGCKRCEHWKRKDVQSIRKIKADISPLAGRSG